MGGGLGPTRGDECAECDVNQAESEGGNLNGHFEVETLLAGHWVAPCQEIRDRISEKFWRGAAP